MTIKGVVFIFGGINTKHRHYRHAEEVYKKHNFHVEFFESTGMKCMVEKENKKIVDKTYNLYEKNKKDWENKPFIIHTNSGGFWGGLFLNSRKKCDTFILECGPFDGTSMDTVVNAFNKILFFPLSKGRAEYILSSFGIPTLKYNPQWFDDYNKKLLELPNITIMNGEKDEYLDKEYVKKFIGNLEENNISTKYVSFENGGHFKLAKSDMKLYQDTIEETINNTIEKFNEKL